MNRLVRLGLFLLISALFIFLRLYNIQNSLFFFNDTGRDFLVLQDWRLSGKMPFLGPQNSALPINQSALYFYLLYPLFLLTNQSPISSIYTAVVVYLASFLYCLFVSKNDHKLLSAVFISFFLITIHPQNILQTRSVWNPTFVTPALLCALVHLLKFIDKKHNKDVLIASAFLSLALSMSYSVAILFIAIFLIILIFARQHSLKFLAGFIVSSFVFNLPTILFELRHKFLLVSSLLQKSATIQERLGFGDKFTDLSNLVIGIQNNTLNIILMSGIILFTAFLFFKWKAYRPLSLILLLTIIFSLLAPFTIRSQYIFGITIPLFFIFGLLPLKFSLALTALISLFYLYPSRLQTYFAPAHRTYSQMETCYKSFCQEQKNPIFVSVESNYHPYHYGPEHRYLLKKLGCEVKNIESENGSANLMAIVNDGGNFQPGNTNYYELELFGKSSLTKKYSCQNNFQIFVLQKDIN